MKKGLLLISILGIFALVGCNSNINMESKTKESAADADSSDSIASSIPTPSSVPDVSASWSNGKTDAEWESYINASTSILIDLKDGSVKNNNGGVTKNGDVIEISQAGTYELVRETSSLTVLVNAGNEDKVELILNNCSITSSAAAPIEGRNADKININVIGESRLTDNRTSSEEEEVNAALYSACDMKIKGNATLIVAAKEYQGIHTKDDLDIKEGSLTVYAYDHAIKGNDSITIEGSAVTAVSQGADALKTSSSSVSSKGNQKGTITLGSSQVKLYAATDAIDSAYDVVTNDGLVLEAYTESYSPYSKDVVVKTDDEQGKKFYLSTTSSTLANYSYKVEFTKEDNTTETVTPTKMAAGGGFSRTTYFEMTMPNTATKLQITGYSGSTQKFQTEVLNVNQSFDCLRLSSSNGTTVSTSWTSYTANQQGGPGGFGGDGNQDKAEYSCKGIKAANQITINGGNIYLKTHDDAIHANNDGTLENSEAPLGNVTIGGGSLTLYSDDDGIHADNALTINGGAIKITKSYEGVEANTITFNGGVTELKSSDDGINAVTKSTTALLKINDGVIYLDADGDGLDSNGNVEMSGGYVVATGPTNSGNGVLDYDGRFTATGGFLLAIGCSGMNQSVSAISPCKSGTKSISTTTNSYVTMDVDGTTRLGIKVTKSSQNYCAYSYVGGSAAINVSNSTSLNFDGANYYVAK